MIWHTLCKMVFLIFLLVTVVYPYSSGLLHWHWSDCMIAPCQRSNLRGCGKNSSLQCNNHDDVFKWLHFPRYWPFVKGIHRSPVNSPHKSQWRGALIFSLICVWINGWVYNPDAGDLSRNRAHHDVTVMTRHNKAWTVCMAPEKFYMILIRAYSAWVLHIKDLIWNL